MLEKKKILVERVVHIVSDWLKDEKIFSSPLVNCHGKSGEGKLFINITRISSGSLLIQEGYSLSDGENRIHRSWSFLKEGSWDVAGLEKNGRPVVIRNLQRELTDFLDRLEVIGQVVCPIGYSYDEEMEDIGLDLVVPHELRPETKLSKMYRQFVSWHGWQSPVFYAVSAGLAILFFGVAISLVNFYGLKLSQKFLVSSSINDMETRIDGLVKDVNSRQSLYDDQVADMNNLEAQLERDEEIFLREFYAMVIEMGRELPSWQPLRKKAYKLIADNISESATNGEILFEMKRLPQSEMRAALFLETNSDTVVTLSSYKPIINSILYPVQVPGREIDGKGFRITSGYIRKRVDPLGAGGGSSYPHHAVDIINVSNIRKITENEAGNLQYDRIGMPNGDIISVEAGVVNSKGFSRVFGNFIEVRHPMNHEISEQYPNATGWRTYYAHLEEPALFKIGEEVPLAAKLGEIGNSGMSTGAHLHFEIRIDLDGARYFDGKLRYNKINPYPGSEEVDYF